MANCTVPYRTWFFLCSKSTNLVFITQTRIRKINAIKCNDIKWMKDDNFYYLYTSNIKGPIKKSHQKLEWMRKKNSSRPDRLHFNWFWCVFVSAVQQILFSYINYYATVFFLLVSPSFCCRAMFILCDCFLLLVCYECVVVVIVVDLSSCFVYKWLIAHRVFFSSRHWLYFVILCYCHSFRSCSYSTTASGGDKVYGWKKKQETSKSH